MTRIQKLMANVAVVVASATFGQAVGCALLQNTAKDPETRALIDKCAAEAMREARDKELKPEDAVLVFDRCIVSRPDKDAGDQ